MFSGLNKVFERSFIIGFAVPALAFLFAAVGIWSLFGQSVSFVDLRGAEPLKDTTTLAFAGTIITFILVIFNFNIMRILEGYWYFDLGFKLNGYYRSRFRKLGEEIENLTKEREESQRENRPFVKKKQRNQAIEERAALFPSREDLVLPTKFGNAIRAFEDYPRVMYRLDSIPAWSRLNAVIPKDYRELMDEARGEMNCWMNFWFLSYLLIIEYVVLTIWFWRAPWVWIIISSLVFSVFLCADQATKAAMGWGEWVKTAFDVYLPDLIKKLGYRPLTTTAELRDFCVNLSQVMIHREVAALEDLDKYRKGFKNPPTLILHEDDKP